MGNGLRVDNNGNGENGKMREGIGGRRGSGEVKVWRF